MDLYQLFCRIITRQTYLKLKLKVLFQTILFISKFFFLHSEPIDLLATTEGFRCNYLRSLRNRAILFYFMYKDWNRPKFFIKKLKKTKKHYIWNTVGTASTAACPIKLFYYNLFKLKHHYKVNTKTWVIFLLLTLGRSKKNEYNHCYYEWTLPVRTLEYAKRVKNFRVTNVLWIGKPVLRP